MNTRSLPHLAPLRTSAECLVCVFLCVNEDILCTLICTLWVTIFWNLPIKLLSLGFWYSLDVRPLHIQISAWHFSRWNVIGNVGGGVGGRCLGQQGRCLLNGLMLSLRLWVVARSGCLKAHGSSLPSRFPVAFHHDWRLLEASPRAKQMPAPDFL